MTGHQGHREPCRRRRTAVAAAVVALMYASPALAGCGAGVGPGTAGAGDPSGAAGTVTVFAAASLTDVLTPISEDFQAHRPGVTVVFNFAGSSGLAAQINQGAPADVFIAANPETMTTVTDAGNATGTPRTVARNQLVIAVPGGNPLGIRGPADLADLDLKIAICAEQVPCGAAAATALAAAGVTVTPVTLEPDARATLSKLTLGEVDAALVYRTDAARASDIDGIEFPASAAAVNDYPAVVVAHAPNPAGARAFLEHLRTDEAVRRFTEAGFQTP